MKGIRSSKLTGLLGAVALVALLNAGVARAQKCVGDFTLASEIRWGKAILPPGHYTLELDIPNDLTTVRGQNGAVMVMSQTHDTDARLESSELILVLRGRKPTVRELRLASLKAVFLYAVPKENPEEVTQETVQIHRVPVTVEGK